MYSYNWKWNRVQPWSNGGQELVDICSLLLSWTKNREGQSTCFFRGLQQDPATSAYAGSQFNNAPSHRLAFSLVPLILALLPKITTSMQALILDSFFFFFFLEGGREGGRNSDSIKAFRKDISPWLKKEMGQEKGLPFLFTLRIWCLQLWEEARESQKRKFIKNRKGGSSILLS